jgi:murein DD-endopeptidase MepM/ murein hydrolase activator NlpD
LAINKKALNKRYAKNVYSKRKKVKSVKSNYNSVYNSVPTAVSKYTAYSNSGSKKSANEDVAQYAMFSSAKAVNFAAHNVSQLPKSETACFFNSYKTSHTSGLSQAENISNKSNFLNVSSSGKNEKDKNYKKRTYERNRRRLYKSKRKRLSTVKAYKSAASKAKALKKVIAGIVKVLSSGKVLLVMGLSALTVVLIAVPIILFLMIFTSSSGNFVQDYLIDVIAAYPADENDITRVNLHWQSLIVSLKEQHKKVPETVTGHYDKKHSEIADIMEDNNRVLSFISAYYMGKRWTFNEEVQNLVTQIFTEMYVIEYNFDSETKKQTKTVQIPENELPSPLPDNYTVLSTYNGICNVYITENVTTVTLNYNITEKVSWDEILNKYLDQNQREKYKNYYDRKGGAIKAFSSPFAFDWSNTITSPFGYRTWDDGSTEFHKGLDFGVPNGTEILAVADGVVEVGTGCNHNYPKDGSCGCNGGFGNYVEIQCENGTLILYGHMSQVAVQNGQTVKNGQVIGYSGCTGWSTGFHCHLQMVKDGEYIDPLVFIRPYTGAPAEKEENN